MEHKAAPLRLKKLPKIEPCHYCGTCQHYTEDYEIDGERYEHCLAGYSYEHTRHCIDCPKWDERRFNCA